MIETQRHRGTEIANFLPLKLSAQSWKFPELILQCLSVSVFNFLTKNLGPSLIKSAIFLLLCFTGCQKITEVHVEVTDHQTTVFSGEAMVMQYKIIIGQPLNETQIDQISRLIITLFQEVNQIYNKWNPDSEISALNRLKANTKVPISQKLETLLEKTDEIVSLSESRFDPTIEPIQKLWKKSLAINQIPEKEEIEKIAPAIGWRNIHFHQGIFYKDHDLTALDLGGIAKGLAIDLIAERLEELGYPDIYVEWGGEIKALGQHPENRPWTIFIGGLTSEDPDDAIDTLYLNNAAIATSGDYLQNWSVPAAGPDNKTTYFHIFDPKTLSPLVTTAHSIASASVMCGSCALADGLSTSAMLFPNVEAAEKWAEKIRQQIPEVSFWIVSR